MLVAFRLRRHGLFVGGFVTSFVDTLLGLVLFSKLFACLLVMLRFSDRLGKKKAHFLRRPRPAAVHRSTIHGTHQSI